MKFYQQLEKHYNAQYKGTYIKPHHDWDLEDYKMLHNYIHDGWIVEDCDNSYMNDSYIINPEWEGEPLWTPPKKIKFIVRPKTPKTLKMIKTPKDPNYIDANGNTQQDYDKAERECPKGHIVVWNRWEKGFLYRKLDKYGYIEDLK
jgi:hypothetical protein